MTGDEHRGDHGGWLAAVHRHLRPRSCDPNVRSPRGMRFDAAYCNSPLCAPHGCVHGCQLVTKSARMTTLRSSLSTHLTHYLRQLGYRTCLTDKCASSDPINSTDPEERLTTDVYPSDRVDPGLGRLTSGSTSGTQHGFGEGGSSAAATFQPNTTKSPSPPSSGSSIRQVSRPAVCDDDQPSTR